MHWLRQSLSGYKKGQGWTAGPSIEYIYFMLILYLLWTVATSLFPLIVFLISIFFLLKFLKMPKGKENRSLKIMITVAGLLLSIILAAIIFIPHTMNYPALIFPEICDMHDMIPLHNVMGPMLFKYPCILESAAFQKDAVLCQKLRYEHELYADCIRKAGYEKADSQVCYQLSENRTMMEECYNAICAINENANDYCDYWIKEKNRDALTQKGIANNDGSICGNDEHCLYLVLRGTEGNCSCEGLNDTQEFQYYSFCIAAKEALTTGECKISYEPHDTILPFDCIAQYSHNPAFCRSQDCIWKSQ